MCTTNVSQRLTLACKGSLTLLALHVSSQSAIQRRGAEEAGAHLGVDPAAGTVPP